MTGHDTNWTDGENTALVQGWRGGMTSKVLADAIGRTRCAVLGRVHRLQRDGILAARTCRTPDRAVALPASVKSKPLPKPTEPGKPVEPNIRLADLDPAVHCRWPFDAKGGGYIYCGHPPERGKAYCTEHLKQARPK